jgi:FixJ family two-component response regulator
MSAIIAALIRSARAFREPTIDRLADVAEAQAAQLAKKTPAETDSAIRQKLARYGLTPRQMDVALAYVRGIAATGVAPTFRQIGDALGISKVSVFELTGELVRKGVMVKTPHRSCGVRFAPGVLS